MTDYTNYERNMSRHEMALRLNIETALRECCESECEKLKKELEDIKTAFEIKSDNLNRQSEEIMKLRQDYECATKEIERLREKVTNQKTQLVGVQQALLNRNMTIEALTGENDRLKKEVKERRVVFEPTSYLLDIQAKDEEIKALRKKNLDLKNENEGLKVKYDHLAEVRDARIREINSLEEQIKDLQDTNRRQSDDIVALHKRNKLLNDEVNKLKNDYYGVLNKYFPILTKFSDLNKDYHELKKQKEDLNADIAKKVLDNIELNEQIEKDIQDYNKLFHEKEKLEKDLEDANKRATPPTQPLYIENLNVTYYANGPIWTNEEKEDNGVEQTA